MATAELLLWNTRHTAKVLGISERTLWTLTHTGQIPFVRIGNLVKYNPDAIRDWIAKRSKTMRDKKGR